MRGMDTTTPALLPAVAAVFFAAGLVKGIGGMGLPTVAMSLLGLLMPPAAAAALTTLPALATNVAQCLGPHARVLLRLLWPAWLGLALATVLAPGLDDAALAQAAPRLLGLVLLAYGAWGLWRPQLPAWPCHPRTLGALAGLATGAITAATGVFVLPLVPCLQMMRLNGLPLERAALVQALGLSFSVATLALAWRLHAGGVPVSAAGATPWALAAAFGGLAAGRLVRDRLGGPAFQRALSLVFIGLGLANILRAAG
jgi:uncharacterized membrane protein YfcA